jgi:site-specific DNA recombinase
MKQEKSKQAVIYTRFSPRGNPDACKSCETQVSYCKKYCEFHDYEVLGVFSDEGMTGRNTDRPGLKEALELTKKHKAVLVFYSLSRLARSVGDAVEISDELKSAKADMCSVTEPLNTTTPFGKVVYAIMAAFAEFEADVISERTCHAMRRHQSEGRKMSKIPPYGWQDDPEDDTRMIPDQKELAAIEDMKRLRKRGMSYGQICLQLEYNGHKARKTEMEEDGILYEVEGEWHATTVWRILKRAERDVF